MNIAQRIVVIIGVILILLSGIFLPYKGTFRSNPTLAPRDIYMGYHPYFSPPQARAIAIALGFESLDAEINNGYFFAHVQLDRVVIQMITIALSTIGLAFLCAGGRNDKRES